ncbi:DUF6065 family protein [Rhodopila sp.]|uniref:DUF6065 family protein n=1 Tax=Rhodopila sp. TaxID=2480087 RepID=UPI003D0FE112
MNAITQPEAAAGKSAPKPKLITFHRFTPNARLPQRADRSAGGSLPTRAFRYCEPATTASGYGYYLFPPIGFSVQWDGHDIMWTFEGAGDWYPLKSVQYPGFREQFDAVAPDEIKQFSPPLLASLQEPGLIQLWTGLVVRTAPGWSLLVRAPANLPRGGGHECFEGIVETDKWFGPLITNIRLTKTNVPIDFPSDYPLLQVQPIPRYVYEESNLNNYEIVPELSQLTPEDWDDYYDTVVRPNTQTVRPRGQYAAAARKRRSGDGTADNNSPGA